MKLKDYFSKRKEQGKIADDKFDKFIEGLPDHEMSDEIFQTLESVFLTRDRAKNDPDIHKKVKSEIYDAIDVNLATLFRHLPTDEAQRVGDEKDTHKKIKMIDAAIASSIEKSKKSNPDASKDLEELKKTNTDLVKRIDEINAKYTADIKQLDEKSKSELKSAKRNFDLLGKIQSIELAKEFTEDPERKKGVHQLILSELGKNHIDYDADGHLAVFEDPAFTKPKFDGNTVISFDKVLESVVKPYVKRNNVDDKKKPLERRPQQQQPVNARPTLKEMRMGAGS